MRHPISPKTHGIIDYTTSTAVALAPRVMNLPKRAAAACYGLAAGYTALSMLTKYPAGARKVVPFKGHGAAEVAIGAALPFVPHMLGLKKHRLRTRKSKRANRKAEYLFYGLTAFTGAVALMTDWNSPKARGQIGGSMRNRKTA
jgi:hypothetical protein